VVELEKQVFYCNQRQATWIGAGTPVVVVWVSCSHCVAAINNEHSDVQREGRCTYE